MNMIYMIIKGYTQKFKENNINYTLNVSEEFELITIETFDFKFLSFQASES